MKRQTKKELREKFLERRRALEPSCRLAADRAICVGLRDFIACNPGRKVAGYVSDGTEPDLKEFMQYALNKGARVFLPRFNAEKESLYEMVEVGEIEEESLASGAYGIMEPKADLPAVEAGETADFVWLVPGVAFDAAGNRLGRGKGIYDRLLGSGGVSVGVFYDCQLSETVPADGHDRKLDAVVTETGIRHFNNKLGETV